MLPVGDLPVQRFLLETCMAARPGGDNQFVDHREPMAVRRLRFGLAARLGWLTLRGGKRKVKSAVLLLFSKLPNGHYSFPRRCLRSV